MERKAKKKDIWYDPDVASKTSFHEEKMTSGGVDALGSQRKFLKQRKLKDLLKSPPKPKADLSQLLQNLSSDPTQSDTQFNQTNKEDNAKNNFGTNNVLQKLEIVEILPSKSSQNHCSHLSPILFESPEKHTMINGNEGQQKMLKQKKTVKPKANSSQLLDNFKRSVLSAPTQYDADVTQNNFTSKKRTVVGANDLQLPLRESSQNHCSHLSPVLFKSPEKRNMGDFTFNLLQDFDKIESEEQDNPGFRYKEPVVRKRVERAKLRGWDCDECRAYYEGLEEEMDPKEIERLKDNCSKHRFKLKPVSNTPENFWCTYIPSTEELYADYIPTGTPFVPKARYRRRRNSEDESQLTYEDAKK